MRKLSGMVKMPYNIIMYSPGGAGKTTFAFESAKPYIVATDEIDTFGFNHGYGDLQNYDEVIKALDEFYNDDQGCETLVIDTLDGVEKLVHQDILNQEKSGKARSMNKAAGGYGNAFNIALDKMTAVKDRLVRIRNDKKKNIIILCHSKDATEDNPIIGASYRTVKMALHDKVEELFVSWVSAVLFLTHEVEKSDGEKFAYGTGNRFIYTQQRPGFIAKNRYNLPPVLEAPLGASFKSFHDGYEAYYNKEPDTKAIIRSIMDLTSNVKDEVKDKVREKVKNNQNNVPKLMKIKKDVEALIGVQ